MKTPKVRLYIRVRLPDGRDSFLDPVWNRNRTLRTGYALVSGAPEHHPEGIYYLRFLRNGKRVWEAVGADADAAIAVLRNKEHDLQSISLGRSAPQVNPEPQDPPPSTAVSTSLEDAIKAYLDEVRRFRSAKTIAACQHMLTLFGFLASRRRGGLLTH